MYIETSIKVKLTTEEEECLKKAKEIVNKIYAETANYECEIEFEDDMAEILDDIQATIRMTI